MLSWRRSYYDAWLPGRLAGLESASDTHKQGLHTVDTKRYDTDTGTGRNGTSGIGIVNSETIPLISVA